MIGETLFVDASAWVVAFDASDSQHAAAQRFWAEARDSRRRFLTSDYVLDETYTLLRRRRNGLRMATAVHELVESSRVIEVARISEELCELAWQLFAGYADQVLSFTDCTSFVLMRERRLL